MAKDQQQQHESLAEFSFDDGVDFFNIGAAAEAKGGINNLLNTISDDDDFEDGGESSTAIEDEGKAGKVPPPEVLSGADAAGVEVVDKPSKKDAKPTKKPPVETPANEDEDEDEEEEHTFFDLDEDEEVGDDIEKPKKGTKPAANQPAETAEEQEARDKKYYGLLAKELREKGRLEHVEVADNAELTEAEFIDLVADNNDKAIDEGIQAFADGLGEEGKDFLRFMKAGGGNFRQYIASFHNTGFDLDNFDPKDEANRGKLLRYYLTNVEKLDAEELEDRLAFIKEGGKEEAYATKWSTALKAAEKKQREEMIAAAEESRKKTEEKIKAFAVNLSQTINSAETVGDFTLTKEDKKELPDFITKPTVKLGKNVYVPQLHATLNKILKAETDEDKQALIKLARILKRNFDMSDIKVKTKTEIVKNANNKLAEAKSGNVKHRSASQDKRSLADYL